MLEKAKTWLNNVRLGHHNDGVMVVVGDKQSGKSTFATLTEKMLKTKALTVDTAEITQDRYFLEDARRYGLIVVENVDPKDVREVMKFCVVSRQVEIRRKGRSPVTINNNMNFMIVTSSFVPHENDRNTVVVTPLAGINVLAAEF